MREPGCPKCSACAAALNQSTYIIVPSGLGKSCALCSRIAGVHIYHPIEDFGKWHIPAEDRDDPYPQSECLRSWTARLETGKSGVTTLPVEELRILLGSMRIRGTRCDRIEVVPRQIDDPRVVEAIEPHRRRAAVELGLERPAPKADPRPSVIRRRPVAA
jgi:hypothetical protein